MGGKVFQRNFKATMSLVARGEGIYLYDEEGKRYLDGCSGALISNIGHCVPEVIEAITEQLKKIELPTLPDGAIRQLRKRPTKSPALLRREWIMCGL